MIFQGSPPISFPKLYGGWTWNTRKPGILLASASGLTSASLETGCTNAKPARNALGSGASALLCATGGRVTCTEVAPGGQRPRCLTGKGLRARSVTTPSKKAETQRGRNSWKTSRTLILSRSFALTRRVCPQDAKTSSHGGRIATLRGGLVRANGWTLSRSFAPVETGHLACGIGQLQRRVSLQT